MINLSIYSVLVPAGSSSPSHTICSKEIAKVEADIINGLYDSLGKQLNYHEMVGAWIFDGIEPEEKNWKRSGIAVLQSLTCNNGTRIQDLFYEIYFILGKSQYFLPMITIKRGQTSYSLYSPRIGFCQNPRHCYNYSKKITPIFANTVSFELIKSGTELIDPNSVVKPPEKKADKKVKKISPANMGLEVRF